MRTKFILLLTLFLTSAQQIVPAFAKGQKAPSTLSSLPRSVTFLAQRENCLDYDRDFEPSPQKRTVELKQFGIQVQIPKNFRTMLRNDGEVSILSPVDYDLIACSARGGRGAGRGLYYRYIRRLPNPFNLPLHNWVSQRERRKKIEMGDWYQNSMKPYQFFGLDGVLVESGFRLKRPSYFVEIPGIDDVVEIGVGCDCDVEDKDIFEFLKNIKLL